MPAPAVLLLLAMQSSSAAPEPRHVVVQASRAIERDSVAALRSHWSELARRNPDDPTALLGLATLDRLTYGYERADQSYRRLRQTGIPDRFRVYALLGRAEADRIHGSVDSAAVSFAGARREAAAVGDRAAEIEALLGLALAMARLEPTDSVLRVFAAAEALVTSEDAVLESRLRCSRAALLVRSGGASARQDAETGLRLAQRVRDGRLQGLCWQALGAWAFINLADPAATAARFDSAAVYQRSSRDLAGLAESLAGSGQNQMSSWDYSAARGDFQVAIVQAERSGDRATEARARRLAGVIAMLTGDFPTAGREMHRAAVLARERGDRAELMRLGSRLGDVTFGLGRVAEAKQAYQEALSVAEHFGDAILSAALRHKMAWVTGVEGDWASAGRQLADDFAFMRSRGLQALIPSLRYGESVILLRQGRLDRAESVLRQALAGTGPNEHAARYQMRSRLAEIELRRGRVDRALQELTTASENLDSLRASLSSEELRRFAFQTAGTQLEEPDFGFATLIAGFVKAGEVEPAFLLAEHRRARALADRLQRTGASPRSLAAPADRSLLRSPDDSTVLLEYVAGRWGQPTTLFTLLGSQVSAYVLLSMDSIAPRVERFLGLLHSGGDARELGARLRGVLLDPALVQLPKQVRRIVIVPDDILHRLPFDVLSFDDHQPLITRYAFGMAPSAAVAASLRSRDRPARTGSILAFGDPVFSASGSSDGAAAEFRDAFDAAGGLGRLPHSAGEARRVGRYGRGSVVRLGSGASEAFLKQGALRDIPVLHFATHALVDDWSAERTSLALTPGGGEDGFLSPAEILGLELPADLVVLSACRTGAGPILRGEGVLGLTAPLLAAGARSVLATHWPIRDRATLPLVESFYRALAAGEPVIEALRSAKLEAIRRGAPASEWAAFLLVGDPLAPVPLEAPRPRWKQWLVVVGAVLLLTLGTTAWFLGRRRAGAGL